MVQGVDSRRMNTALAAACVFFVAAAGYMLSFSGVPISDDEELYASAARNLAINGTLSAEQLTGNARLAGSYHGVEPAFPALASLWYRLFLPVPAGRMQTLYLLTVLCTALSAALIVVIASQLGYGRNIAAAAALLFAFGSMAWPYAKTLFREPMIGLLLLGSLSTFLWMVRDGRRAWQSILMGALLLALLVTLVLMRAVMAAAAAVLLIALPLTHPAIRQNKRRIVVLAAGGITLLLAPGVFLGAQHATDADVFYRFTGEFVADAITRLDTIPHTHLAEALTAPLVSPWKGLLLYSPIGAVGLVAAIVYLKRQPVVTLLVLATLASLLTVQALAYDAEWWTPTWGSRFLLPVIPLLVVAALPVLEKLRGKGRRGWVPMGAIFAAGFIVQLPAVLFNPAEFTAATYRDAGPAFPQGLVWNIGKSPILAQWHAVSSQEPDLLLWRTALLQPVLVLIVCVLGASAIVLGLLLWRSSLGGDRGRVLLAGSSVAVLLMSAALLNAGRYDPAYEMSAFQPLCSYIENHLEPADVLIVEPYPGPAWQYLMNAECGQRTWYSLPYENAPEAAARFIAQKILAGRHYWLIQQYWGEYFAPDASSAAAQGDVLLQQETLAAPYHLWIGSYERGKAK